MWFALPYWFMILSTFPCTCWSFTYHLWKNVYLCPSLDFNWMRTVIMFCYRVVWVPFIFWVLTPYQLYDLQIFFLILQVFIILLIVSLCRRLLVWYSPLFIFDFVAFAIGVVSKNPCQDPRQGAFFCFLPGILCDENGILLLWSCSLKI